MTEVTSLPVPYPPGAATGSVHGADIMPCRLLQLQIRQVGAVTTCRAETTRTRVAGRAYVSDGTDGLVDGAACGLVSTRTRSARSWAATRHTSPACCRASANSTRHTR